MNDSYSFKTIEKKWQKNWEESSVFKTLEDKSIPKYYVLEMFPYPSGKIHMGHVRNYSLGDVIARYKKSKGYRVLHPMGWDAFGLPAENAARESKSHPAKWTYENIAAMRKQIKALGFAIDWSKEVITCSPDYYKHEQRIFLEFYKKGLAYKKESWVNWDPVENSVLANEQVINGKGWRSGAAVEQRKLQQWFLKITDFADSLLGDLETLKKWPDKVKNMQINWIGKSQGATVSFNIIGRDDKIAVYTTRPETLYGASFIALSIHHDLATQLQEQSPEIKEFIAKCQSLGSSEENSSKEEKIGIDTGLKVINPINNEELKVFIANYVLDYGTKAVLAVPAHDVRDFDFAKKYNQEIKFIIHPLEGELDQFKPFEDLNGILFNSGVLDGLTIAEAKVAIIKHLVENKCGEESINFRLNDWGVSRQRYWGAPIPIIYCDNCGCVGEKLENLPVELPNNVSFNKTGNPLDSHPTWKFIKCPYCDGDATRETDTFDTFFESSWYFFKYITQGSEDVFNQDMINSWMAVDQYVGGVEHAVMHLLYARFFVKALDSIGFTNNINEPFINLMTQGMICHKTYKTVSGKWVNPSCVRSQGVKLYCKDSGEEVIVGRSEKMSKSKKNVIDPDYICSIYGSDTARMFVLSDSPPDKDLEWSDEGVEGIYKFINRLWRYVTFAIAKTENTNEALIVEKFTNEDLEIYKTIQRYIFEVEKNIEGFHINKAIALNRELFNMLESEKDKMSKHLIKYSSEVILKLFNPIIPHVCEELWYLSGHKNFLYNENFPVVSQKYLDTNEVTIAIQVLGKTRGTIKVSRELNQEEALAAVIESKIIDKYIEDKPIKKVIYVSGKIINIIV